MACNECYKTFSLLRKEKGCPSCGFSYCSNCLKSKIFVPKLNSEAKVCTKCQSSIKLNQKTHIEPPEAYYKRIAAIDKKSQADSRMNTKNSFNPVGSSKDQEILERLQKLKDDTNKMKVTNKDIANQLEKMKGEIPSTSDYQLQLRLANLRGVPVTTLNKSVTVMPDNRTEQEQVDDLIKQYVEHANIDEKYQNEFKEVIDNIQTRLQKLKNSEQNVNVAATKDVIEESEDEDEVVNQIIKKTKAESSIGNDVTQLIVDLNPKLEELPFCEICNEDANMRCLGCKYLFCKQCFIEHKDEDDGCDKYVLFKPPKNVTS